MQSLNFRKRLLKQIFTNFQVRTTFSADQYVQKLAFIRYFLISTNIHRNLGSKIIRNILWDSQSPINFFTKFQLIWTPAPPLLLSIYPRYFSVVFSLILFMLVETITFKRSGCPKIYPKKFIRQKKVDKFWK